MSTTELKSRRPKKKARTKSKPYDAAGRDQAAAVEPLGSKTFAHEQEAQAAADAAKDDDELRLEALLFGGGSGRGAKRQGVKAARSTAGGAGDEQGVVDDSAALGHLLDADVSRSSLITSL